MKLAEIAAIKERKKKADEEAARVEAEMNASFSIGQAAIDKMNLINNVASYDLPEIGITSLADYQDLAHV